MTPIVVIKILVLGALGGGFLMFLLVRRKAKSFTDDGVGVINSLFLLLRFMLQVLLAGALVVFGFWFVTRFMA